MIRQKNKRYGFTIVEMLVALAVMALLLTAVAVAFNASANNYEENRDMFNAINTGRQAMLRMTSELRTAKQVPLTETNPTIQCSFTPANSDYVSRFRFDSGTQRVYFDYFDSSGNAHSAMLCDHVSAMSFGRLPTTVAVKSVQMSMTIDINGNRQTIASAVVLRKAI